jgi:hypothetical protein
MRSLDLWLSVARPDLDRWPLSGQVTLSHRTRIHINIHLLTEYEGNSTFIVPKVPTIFRGNAEENSWYRGDIKVLLPEYQV